jgi:hypothetical protein
MEPKVLVISALINWDDGDVEDVAWTFVTEQDGHDPIEVANAIIENGFLADDWGDYEHEIIANSEAIERHRLLILKNLGL